MNSTPRTYTLTDAAPRRVTSDRPAGAVLVVRVGGRRVRYRLTATELHGPHAGTYAAEPVAGVYL
jgi:hypothetical protein